jgi:hypothetical protein
MLASSLWEDRAQLLIAVTGRFVDVVEVYNMWHADRDFSNPP